MSVNAASLDRSGEFHFSSGYDSGVSCGDFVVLVGKGFRLLANVTKVSTEELHTSHVLPPDTGVIEQVLPIRMDRPPAWKGRYTGTGIVLAEIPISGDPAAFRRSEHFGECELNLAPASVIGEYFAFCYQRGKKCIEIGSLLNTESVRISLLAKGFGRPTGVFGQSGSGKSYAIGVILERLHWYTEANIVVLDPNGDFAAIDELENSPAEFPGDSADITILHSDKRSRMKILRTPRVRVDDVELHQIASLLRVDVLSDSSEFRQLRFVFKDLSHSDGTVQYFERALKERSAGLPVRLQERADLLGIDKLRIWSRDPTDEKVCSVIGKEGVQTVVVDLSSLSAQEQSIVTAAVLRRVWALQSERRAAGTEQKPTLVIVDEAHNVFPSKPQDEDQRVTLELGGKLAGEGRKYGAFLLVASQLPSKIHEHVLTQCSNLVLGLRRFVWVGVIGQGVITC